MKKIYLIILILTVAWLLFRGGPQGGQGRGRILQRINSTISFIAWSLLAIYGCAFIYWFFKTIF